MQYTKALTQTHLQWHGQLPWPGLAEVAWLLGALGRACAEQVLGQLPWVQSRCLQAAQDCSGTGGRHRIIGGVAAY